MNKQERIKQAEREVELMRANLADSEERLEDLKTALKFYVGQQVIVWDAFEAVVTKGVIEDDQVSDGSEYPYILTNGNGYKSCKPDPDAVTLPVWIEHDGSSGPKTRLEGDQFCIYYKVGMGMEGRYASNIPWSIVTRYCPIPAYEAL